MRLALLFLSILIFSSCATAHSGVKSYVIRLKPGQELKTELAKLARENQIRAGSVVSAVGSLTDVALRFANKEETTKFQGHFEIVSLSGYIAGGELHLHMAVSDGNGKTLGGHVMEGNRVYTTLVVTIHDNLAYKYRREFDSASGYNELVVEEI